MSKVAIQRCQTYEYDLVYSSLINIIENTDFPAVENKRVLLKPNILSDSKPELGITTNPVVVEAMVNIVKSKGAREVLVGDSPGLHTPQFHGRNCGIAAVCERTNATWVNFAANPKTHKVNRKTKLNMARVLDEVDVVISIAKFKTHELMYLTGCVKNMFGTLPGLNKSPCHIKAASREKFAALICDIFKESHCNYGIVDGIIGMEGPGPANGTLRQIGLLIGSSDCFEVDEAMRIIMSYKQDDIPILNEGKRKGLTSLTPTWTLLDPNSLVIKDYRIVDVAKKEGLIKSLLIPFLTRGSDRKKAQKRPTPNFDEKLCIRCKRCIDICPARALSLKNNVVTLEETKCVRCYCCHEMCPVAAITIEKDK